MLVEEAAQRVAHLLLIANADFVISQPRLIIYTHFRYYHLLPRFGEITIYITTPRIVSAVGSIAPGGIQFCRKRKKEVHRVWQVCEGASRRDWVRSRIARC